jgi:hypothetical protein
MKMTKILTPALFVQLYMESHAAGHTMRRFADRIGLTYRQAAARTRFYRKRGVQLPPFVRATQRSQRSDTLDVAALNAIVAGDQFELPVDAPVHPRRRLNGTVVIAR